MEGQFRLTKIRANGDMKTLEFKDIDGGEEFFLLLLHKKVPLQEGQVYDISAEIS